MTRYDQLELDEAGFRGLVAAAMDRLAAHLRALPELPACPPGEDAADVARSLREPPPRRGQALDEVLTTLFERALPVSYTTPGPGYLAYVPGGGLLHAAVADLIADATNRFVGLWRAAPGLVQLESNVVQWLCALVGLPDGAGGVLTTGGSLANFSATVTARRDRLGERFGDGTIYTSTQAHHSVIKAAALAGFPAGQVRALPVDEQLRVRVPAIAAAIAEDRQRGLRPCMIVGAAGTTNTGAVDDLAALAELAAREGLWFHVDAAYGGCFALTERGRRTLRGIERADSITLDPHKGLFLPYGTGALLVRDPAALRRAHAGAADYLPPMQEDPAFVDFCELSPELSRDFRGLRLWLPLKLCGVDAFAAALDEKLDLAELAAEQLRGLPDVELVAPPQLSLLAFRHAPPRLRGDEAALAEHNRALLAAINRRQRVFLTPTVVGGVFVLRICVLSFRTHRDRVEQGLDDIRAALAELA